MAFNLSKIVTYILVFAPNRHQFGLGCYGMELSLSSTLENSKPRPFALESVLSFPRLKSIDFHYFQTLLIT